MTEQTKPVLKGYFTTGSKPTQAQFEDLIDTFVTETSAGNADIPTARVMANVTGVSAAPVATTMSAILDATVTAARGSVVFRGASGWESLSPGTNGQLLSSGGSSNDISWVTATGTGTVTSVSAGGGLTASTNPIVGAGDISLKDIPATRILANPTAVSAVPVATTLTRVIDAAVSGVQGGVLYRNASDWVALAPGTTGQVLTTAGVSANPSWTTATGWTTVYDQTVTTATQIDVSGLSTYKEIRIEASMSSSTTSSISLQTETSGSYYTAYSWMYNGTSTSNNTAAVVMQVGPATNAADTKKLTVNIYSLGDSNMPTLVTYDLMSTVPGLYNGFAYRNAKTAENGIRLTPSAGNFSGRVKVMAV